MSVKPDFQTFTNLHESGVAQVLWTDLVADLETPVSAYLKLTGSAAWSFLLESVEGGAVRGRYSIIGCKPDLLWRCKGRQAEINRHARTDDEAFRYETSPPLESLRALLKESRIELPAHLPPMAAGLVGYFGYDMVRLMEHLPTDKPPALGLYDGLFIRPTVMAIFDSVLSKITLVTPVWPQRGRQARAAYNQACERMADAMAALERPMTSPREDTDATLSLPEPVSNTSQEEFHRMVGKAKDYISAGDIFQVVLSHRFSLPFPLPSFSLYRALRRTNPSPFMFHLEMKDFAIVGSSPEILVRLRDGKVTIRPIAGTRRRGVTAEEDKALAAELLADPKEQAEHLMLLDLGRNDVGRVSKIGSVRVTERSIIEHYSHVMHIVSNVEGEIDPIHDALSALIAGFPAGTVSGAPKVRAMEIIDELEKDRRGVYGGGIGYLSANGVMDTCIALRTAVVKDGVMHVQAGAGLVYDSVPESEYQETENKAKALIRAAEEAVHFATRPDRGQ